MAERSERLLHLSAQLTGVSSFQLSGTGMLHSYLRALEDRLPPNILDAFLHDTDADTLLDDAVLGDVARRVIVMWYSGTWVALEESWRAAHGAGASSATGVISAEAYQAGLQWVVAGAHPAGAQQQGFGAWSLPPGGIRR